MQQPRLRFKGFRDEWKNERLGNLIKVTSSKRVHMNEWKKNGIPFFRARDLVACKNNKKIKDPLYISEFTYNNYSKISGKPQINDLLVTGVGTIGIPYLVTDLKPFYFKDGNIIWFHNNNFNGRFLYSFFQSEKFSKFIKKTTGVGTVATYTINDGKQTPIIYPSLTEQTNIGKYFHLLDRMIELQSSKLKHLKRLKRGYLQKMFTSGKIPKLRFNGFNDKWGKDKLNNLGNTFNSLSGKNKNDFGHGRAKYITYMNVHDNPIANKNFTGNIEIDSKQNDVKYGDVLFTTSSETPQEVGLDSVWLSNEPNVYLNSFCFGCRLNKPINYYFIAYALRSNDMREKIIVLAQGISRYNISKRRLMELTLNYPSLPEQKKIGHYFNLLDQMIDLASEQLASLHQDKKGYLQKMFI